MSAGAASSGVRSAGGGAGRAHAGPGSIGAQTISAQTIGVQTAAVRSARSLSPCHATSAKIVRNGERGPIAESEGPCPIALPSLDPARAEATNRLLRRREAFEAAGETIAIAFAHPRGRLPDTSATRVTIGVEDAQGRGAAMVFMERDVLAGLLSRAGCGVPDAPPATLVHLLECAVTPWLDELERALESTLVVRALGSERHVVAPPGWTALECTVTSDTERSRFALACDRDALQAVARLHDRTRRVRDRRPWPVRWRARIGSVRVGMRDLASLRTGDALLPDALLPGAPSPAGRARVELGGLAFTARILPPAGARMRLEAEEAPRALTRAARHETTNDSPEDHMRHEQADGSRDSRHDPRHDHPHDHRHDPQRGPDASTTPTGTGSDSGGNVRGDAGGDAGGDASGLRDLPLEIVFEIGRGTIPLDRIEGIGPGHVLELDDAATESGGVAVDMVVNGRRIGRGELVSLGDRTAVRIVRLFGET